jgi:hypothetical protein
MMPSRFPADPAVPFPQFLPSFGAALLVILSFLTVTEIDKLALKDSDIYFEHFTRQLSPGLETTAS